MVTCSIGIFLITSDILERLLRETGDLLLVEVDIGNCVKAEVFKSVRQSIHMSQEHFPSMVVDLIGGGRRVFINFCYVLILRLKFRLAFCRLVSGYD